MAEGQAGGSPPWGGARAGGRARAPGAEDAQRPQPGAQRPTAGAGRGPYCPCGAAQPGRTDFCQAERGAKPGTRSLRSVPGFAEA